jgi:hypothetical protein
MPLLTLELLINLILSYLVMLVARSCTRDVTVISSILLLRFVLMCLRLCYLHLELLYHFKHCVTVELLCSLR